MERYWVWFAVAVGGGLGSVLRFALSKVLQSSQVAGFPWGTFAANIMGCLAIGFCFAWLDSRVSPVWRDFVRVGFLGGLTTFSSFSIECFSLFEKGHYGLAGGYLAGSLLGGLAATAVGVFVGRGLMAA